MQDATRRGARCDIRFSLAIIFGMDSARKQLPAAEGSLDAAMVPGPLVLFAAMLLLARK